MIIVSETVPMCRPVDTGSGITISRVIENGACFLCAFRLHVELQ